MVEAHENGDFYCYNEKGELHCEGAPAVEWADGRKEWHVNGKMHREDGAALILPDGGERFYINDIKLTKAEFDDRMKIKSQPEQKNPNPQKQPIYGGRDPRITQPSQNKNLYRGLRKTFVADLDDYCFINPRGNGHYVEVTKWMDGDGVDIVVDNAGGQKTMSLTFGEFNAIRACIHTMRDGSY